MSTEKQLKKGKLLSTSKKIKKTPVEKKSKKKEKDDHRYETFDNETKDNVIDDLLGEIQKYHNLAEIPSLTEFEKAIKKAPKEYNKILQNILIIRIPNFKEMKRDLSYWRKKVKSWIKNQHRPETRGGLVVPAELSQEFYELVIKCLDSIRMRVFNDLRSRLFECLKELGKEVDKNSFSKHWWHNYRQRHPDINDKWAAKPLERTVKKGDLALQIWKKRNEEKMMKKKGSEIIEEEEVEVPTTNYQSPMSQDTMKCHGVEAFEGHDGIKRTIFYEDEENFHEIYEYQGPSSNSYSREDEESPFEEESQKEMNYLPIDSFLNLNGNSREEDEDDFFKE